MVTVGTVFELLEEKRRRYVLYYLYERDGPVGVEELVKTVDEWEDEPPPQNRSLDRFEEIALELKHTHLPKSAEVEFVQYDPDQNIVQIQGSPHEFDTFVTVARLVEKPEE
ncbi:hypothetical protein CV102_06945 [Natronococcus pandeyae]|uniref:DUF7344 domain-containing protein n=1 Tax=Natronococcus pandeyae TaxID=2055836 RepID=A0A8J8TSQ3_9EURY|nr:hypothetical protein [Natronococcus pandeyae]TYL39024.1 hypothetical protein CV102_06945 [Natronococcus pandeyae]